MLRDPLQGAQVTDVLYAAQGAGNPTSDLYTADQATGTLTSIGPIGFALTALATNAAGDMYGCTSVQSAVNPRSLISVDPLTGAGTLIGSLGLAGGGSLSDMGFDASGNLWGWYSIGGRLTSVNLATGAGTLIGTTGSFSGSLDFDLADVLWHIGGSDGSTETVNLATGAITIVAAMSVGDVMQAGKFDSSGVFWASRRVTGSVSRLVTINEHTGVVTDIADFSLGQIDALAFAAGTPPPPPPTFIFDGPSHRAHT